MYNFSELKLKKVKEMELFPYFEASSTIKDKILVSKCGEFLEGPIEKKKFSKDKRQSKITISSFITFESEVEKQFDYFGNFLTGSGMSGFRVLFTKPSNGGKGSIIPGYHLSQYITEKLGFRIYGEKNADGTYNVIRLKKVSKTLQKTIGELFTKIRLNQDLSAEDFRVFMQTIFDGGEPSYYDIQTIRLSLCMSLNHYLAIEIERGKI